VEVFAELRPDVIPHGRVCDAVVDQNHGLRAGTAFFIVKFAAFDVDESSRTKGGALRKKLSAGAQNKNDH
jgi:hypothetical protein